jgi:chorismate synthase
MFNSFGNLLKITTFGESHGEAIGGILDGMPANIEIDISKIQVALDRRRPGQSHITSARNEPDKVKLLSGIYEGKTTGHSIGFLIPNEDKKSKDYDELSQIFRPSHADFTYFKKYGIRDPKGGGRASARETANWVVAGALVQNIIPNIEITAFVSQVGSIKLTETDVIDFEEIEKNPVRCPHRLRAKEMEDFIAQIKEEGDTVGGIISCVAKNVPVGLGEPIFHKLHAQLGQAMLSINAVKGVSFGAGFDTAAMRGSEYNDIFNPDQTTKTNHSGGIQGGISNGMDITFQVAFKPVSTLMKSQESITHSNESIEYTATGRHDPCVVPRAVPIVEAMTLLVLADMYLMAGKRIF